MSKPPAPDTTLGDGTRRTRLASERTELAWWRTGLTAIAVALGVGGILPQVDRSATQWPYVALGVGFALYGVALMVLGTLRGREIDQAVARGEYAEITQATIMWLTVVGAMLGLGTAVLLITG